MFFFMVQSGSFLRVTDKTGVLFAQCLKVFGAWNKRLAIFGDVILVSVKRTNLLRIKHLKIRLRKKLKIGGMHRALLIRSKKNFCRMSGIWVKFDENSVIFVNRRRVPVVNRIYGPMLKEVCTKWPSVGCVTRCVM